MGMRSVFMLKMAALLLLQNSLLAVAAVIFSDGASPAMMALLVTGVTVLSVATAMMATRFAILRGTPQDKVTVPDTQLALPAASHPSRQPEASVPMVESRHHLSMKAASAETERLQGAETALNALDAALRRLAVGDLEVRLDNPLADHLEPLRSDFNRAVAAIADAMAALTSSSDTLHGACSEARFALHQQSANAVDDNPLLLAASTGLDDAAQALRGQERALRELVLSVSAIKVRRLQGNERADQEVARLSHMDGRIGAMAARMRDAAFQANMLAVDAGAAPEGGSSAQDMLRHFVHELRSVAEEGAEAAKEALIVERDVARCLAENRDTINRLARDKSAADLFVSDLEQKLSSAADALGDPAALLNGTASTLAELARSARQHLVVNQAVEGALDRMTGEITAIERQCGRFIPVTVLHDTPSPEGHPPRPHRHLRLIKS